MSSRRCRALGKRPAVEGDVAILLTMTSEPQSASGSEGLGFLRVASGAASPVGCRVVLECTNVAPYSVAVARATGRPVYDAVTLLRRFWSGLASAHRVHQLQSDNDPETVR